MSADFKESLLEVIASKIISQHNIGDVKLPEAFGMIRWTGWKSDWSRIEKHAQLVWFFPREAGKNRNAFYVDLPSMNHGSLKNGGLMNIESSEASHYLYEDTTSDDIKAWIKEGFMLLLDDVLKECPWLTEVPSGERK